jgi:hypothetical protein
MVKKKTSQRRTKFADMTVDEIFAAWEQAAHSGLKQGVRFERAIFAPNGRIVRDYKRAIERRMRDTGHPFNAMDFRKSTRVAKDIGRICSIVVADAPRKVVTTNVFDRAAELAKVHATCPAPPAHGAGTWCDR